MIDITDARAVRSYIPRNNQLVYSPTCQLSTEKWVDARAVRPYKSTAFPMQKQMECAGNVGTHGPCVRSNAIHLPSLFKVVSKLLFTVSYGLVSYPTHFTAQYGWYYRAIWVILQANMGHIGNRYPTYWFPTRCKPKRSPAHHAVQRHRPRHANISIWNRNSTDIHQQTQLLSFQNIIKHSFQTNVLKTFILIKHFARQ